MKQQSFFKSKSEFSASRISYGGNTRGLRKTFRPLDRRRPLHVTMKSSHAKGKLSLLSKRLKVSALIEAWAETYRIKLHRVENMGNHLHLLVSFKTKSEMQKFMKVIAAVISRLMTGARKGRAFGMRFWDFIPFTRIVTGRRDFAALLKYADKNEVEREFGPFMREAIELHERATREAKRKKMTLYEVMDAWVVEHSKNR